MVDEDKIVESVLKRMNEKGMFTLKLRTGESKEHIKDPKLKNVDVLELYKREKKDDIAIVFEGNFVVGGGGASAATSGAGSATK